jgi:hypothetical protein
MSGVRDQFNTSLPTLPNQRKEHVVSKATINDLVDQYQRTFRMLYSTLEEFDAEQWVTGISF